MDSLRESTTQKAPIFTPSVNTDKDAEARLVYSTSRAEAEDYEPALSYRTGVSAGLAQDA